MSSNEIRLTPGEIAFAVRVLSKNHNNITYEPEAVVERVVREINEQRKRATALGKEEGSAEALKAGPFSAEGVAINRVWSFRDKEEDRRHDTRVQALRFAIEDARDRHFTTAEIVESAEEFHTFLRGGDS